MHADSGPYEPVDDNYMAEKLGIQDRIGFIKKVYGILSVQLTATALFCLYVMNLDTTDQKAIFLNIPLCVLVLVTYFITFCALVCCNLHRKVPVNYFLLFIFTACVSFIVGSVVVRYNPLVVFEAVVLTAAVVIGITIYAFTTKNDFTVCGPIIWVGAMIFISGFILGIMLSAAG